MDAFGISTWGSGLPATKKKQLLFALACSSSSKPQCAQGEFQPRTLNQGKYNHLSLENRLIQEQHDPLQTAIPHRLNIKVPSFFSNLCCYFPLLFFCKVRKEGKNPWTQSAEQFETRGWTMPRKPAVKWGYFSCAAPLTTDSLSVMRWIFWILSSLSKCWQIGWGVTTYVKYQINIDALLI